MLMAWKAIPNVLRQFLEMGMAITYVPFRICGN